MTGTPDRPVPPNDRNPGPRPNRRAVAAANVANVLGAASAAMTAYWAVGGSELLDTVGGEIERWGRERSTGVVVVLWVVVILKLVGALAPFALIGLAADRLPSWTRSRTARSFGWVGALALTAYGGVLTIAGLLLQVGVLDPATDADRHALAWHTYFWDPWFLLWGGAATLALWWSRPHPTS